MEIAGRIAVAVRGGLPNDAVVDVLDAADVTDVASYDAAVLGSAISMGRWLKDARHLARRINGGTATLASITVSHRRSAWTGRTS